MEKCLYCDLPEYPNNINIKICWQHHSRICDSCFYINNYNIKLYKGCCYPCKILANIRYKNTYIKLPYVRCLLCDILDNPLHHCIISIKNKYMNVNVL